MKQREWVRLLNDALRLDDYSVLYGLIRQASRTWRELPNLDWLEARA